MSPPLPTDMLKSGGRQHKPTSLISEKLMYYFGGFLTAFLLVWCHWSPSNPTPVPCHEPSNLSSSPNSLIHNPSQHYSDPTEINLPDPRIGKPIKNWDSTRQQWLTLNPNLNRKDRILMITGSGPAPCRNPAGDYYLLRLFKNKVDYCRIHNCEIFYNSAPLQPKISSYWAKYPVIRAAMIAHPEVEWIWWVDSDAVITDMSFSYYPLLKSRYSNHNLIVQGWSNMIYGENKSWYGANAGVFYIRNCQWSMDLMERWSSMGPGNRNYPRWGTVQKSVFPDKTFPESDDQTGLLYLLVKENDKWGDKVYIEESQEDFQLFWEKTVSRLKNQDLIQKWNKELGSRKIERFGADKMEPEVEQIHDRLQTDSDLKRPFITHFAGCQPCHSKPDENQQCYDGMEMVLNFADNQVLLNYGYVHPDLQSSSLIEPLPGLSD